MPNCRKCGKPVETGVVLHEGCYDGWISAKERLPRQRKYVLAVATWRMIDGEIAFRSHVIAKHNGKRWKLPEYEDLHEEVEYWMELPPMPKED